MSDLATAQDASEVVNYLLSSFPQQAPDPDVYGDQLTALCTGRPKSLLKQMVSPIDGLLGKSEFLPSIATVKKWLDARTPKHQGSHPEHRLFLPEPEWTPPSPEERAAMLAKMEKAKRAIRAAAESMQAGFKRRSSTLTKEQQEALDRYIADPNTP